MEDFWEIIDDKELSDVEKLEELQYLGYELEEILNELIELR